ncbi:ATP-binding cassette domain-containing protein [Acinetobacter tianfuensis]|uniref:ATP-binding cassette domain-containing protein n=1 Tax=Acinetobacter tianfuensis TaxID=2419603 RepID=A0A3A8ECF0_9GAMM|nr:ATP-binding cassette domain-containing protein [Acinetobacter tianfuensis]RKG31196.1 ATP-binding cassette domain-containing protein [Acinetobacter tianfuensis]
MLQCDFQFQHADFTLNAQLQMQEQLLGIMGPSGSGKSTLLKNLVGLLQPQQGFIRLNERALFDDLHRLNMPMHKRRIALIFQKAWLFPHMNVQQNLQYAEKLTLQVAQKFQYTDIVDLLELQPLLKRRVHELSGGEAQRVSIGRALLSSPDLLLLDEPLTGLDRRLKSQILPFLNNVKTQTKLPMLYVTHHAEELEYLNAQIMYLEQGKLIT